MRSRRHFLQLSCAVLAASAVRAAWLRADPQPPAAAPSTPPPTNVPAPSAAVPSQLWLPLVGANASQAPAPALLAAQPAQPRTWIPVAQSNTAPIPQTSWPPQTGALIGSASGSMEQAIAWLAPRAAGYTLFDITSIVGAYQSFGAAVQMDWFLAIAQLVHETGSLTSWWSQRPRRNPAGISVTGASRAGLANGTPGPAPGASWAWKDELKLWLQGVSFATWERDAVPGHLGRLLAYALPDGQGNANQQDLIRWALLYRGLPASHRGSAQVITGLNGRWAVPGTTYGQRILEIAAQMRG